MQVVEDERLPLDPGDVDGLGEDGDEVAGADEHRERQGKEIVGTIKADEGL